VLSTVVVFNATLADSVRVSVVLSTAVAFNETLVSRSGAPIRLPLDAGRRRDDATAALEVDVNAARPLAQTQRAAFTAHAAVNAARDPPSPPRAALTRALRRSGRRRRRRGRP
jgi:hypothetical protein